MLHPVLPLRFGASALSAEVLILAPGMLLAELARAAGEVGEAQHAVVELVRQRHRAGIIHVGVLSGDGIQVLIEHQLLTWSGHAANQVLFSDKPTDGPRSRTC